MEFDIEIQITKQWNIQKEVLDSRLVESLLKAFTVLLEIDGDDFFLSSQ